MLTALQAPLPVDALPVVWFLLISVLWIGYFFLEGFDYGVAMLIPFLGRKSVKDDEKRRRVIINSIGPVWDGNEVWLLTAGGATFAAFPGWYATLFSALYLPLFLVLVGLILRGVSFEYRAKRPETKWRRTFDWTACIGSFLPALVFGVGFANFVKGLRLDERNLMAQGFWSLFSPFALVGGLLFVALFLTHGAVYLALKTKDDVHDAAKAFAEKSSIVAAVLLIVFVLWQNIGYSASANVWWNAAVLTWIVGALGVVAIVAAHVFTRKGRDGWAFIATGLTVVLLIADIMIRIYGNLGFIPDASLPANQQLNIVTAASSPYTLKLMTVFACIMVPIVLAYQAWTYWVFRKRLSTTHIPDDDLAHAAA